MGLDSNRNSASAQVAKSLWTTLKSRPVCSTLLYHLLLENFIQLRPAIGSSAAAAPSACKFLLADLSVGDALPWGPVPGGWMCRVHHGSWPTTSDSCWGWAPHWPTVSSCSSTSFCYSSVPEELENPVTSQQAFNPLAQLSRGGCRSYLPWGRKVAESPGSGPAPSLHSSPIASSQNLLFRVPCCLLCLFPISSLYAMFLAWSRPSWGCLPVIPPLIQEPVPALFSSSHRSQNTSCCLSLEEEPMTFFFPLDFLNVCPKLIFFSWLWQPADTFMLASVWQGRRYLNLELAHSTRGGWTSTFLPSYSGMCWHLFKQFFCSTWKFLSIAVKVMGNVMQHRG